MSKREYLSKLKEYLGYELPESIVREKSEFYSDYIDSQLAAGKKLETVIDELGDPQLIAKSITDALKSGPDGIPGSADDIDFSKEIYGEERKRQEDSWGRTSSETRSAGGGFEQSNPWGGNIHTYNFGCFTVILVLLILISIFTLIGAIIGALSPVLAPICMVLLIMWLLQKTGGSR